VAELPTLGQRVNLFLRAFFWFHFGTFRVALKEAWVWALAVGGPLGILIPLLHDGQYSWSLQLSKKANTKGFAKKVIHNPRSLLGTLTEPPQKCSGNCSDYLYSWSVME
jgi:hypothetical protein